MGIYPFVLATLVVLLHIAGFSWIGGWNAVSAPYCVSAPSLLTVIRRAGAD